MTGEKNPSEWPLSRSALLNLPVWLLGLAVPRLRPWIAMVFEARDEMREGVTDRSRPEYRYTLIFYSWIMFSGVVMMVFWGVIWGFGLDEHPYGVTVMFTQATFVSFVMGQLVVNIIELPRGVVFHRKSNKPVFRSLPDSFRVSVASVVFVISFLIFI
ncbi:hypothetical protein ACFQZ2_01180 [Streptomonospora algeriensis]|uniref:Uncharacterized protein n=1 Tax=Streptomonospora algeriensis TaxID=995084 RepID=A0ABW3B9C2_9ACTN